MKTSIKNKGGDDDPCDDWSDTPLPKKDPDSPECPTKCHPWW